MDHREQIVLQGALNALPRNLSVANYRFRHIADRLAQRGLLKIVQSTTESAQYSITPAGQGKLETMQTHARSSNELPEIAAE
jgi:predicted transcriptional regulator